MLMRLSVIGAKQLLFIKIALTLSNGSSTNRVQSFYLFSGISFGNTVVYLKQTQLYPQNIK